MTVVIFLIWTYIVARTKGVEVTFHEPYDTGHRLYIIDREYRF